MRVFFRLIAVLAVLLAIRSSGWCEDKGPSLRLTDSLQRWTLGLHSEQGVTHLGLDSEGTGREKINLLAGPMTLTFSGAGTTPARWQVSNDRMWTFSIPTQDRKGTVNWTISQDGDDLLWRLAYEGEGTVANLRLDVPFNPRKVAATLLPASVLAQKKAGLGPWLLVAPDFGHLRVEEGRSGDWNAVISGVRGRHDSPGRPGKPWQLTLQFHCQRLLAAGSPLSLRFRPAELAAPKGIDPVVWKQIRRPYLNNWQPCSTWAGPGKSWVLGNNVLSNPAACSLWFYSEPMLFWQEPTPGVDLKNLLRWSLDYNLGHRVSQQGHVNAFGTMYDLYVHTGACMIISAWDYWAISHDVDWLQGRIGVLHRMGDYLLRRDVDKDGLVESYGGGNAGTLREPERSDIWLEYMNFGHKNARTNALSYRAFLCLAEMLEATGHPKGAEHYRHHAARLREAYVRQLLSPENGWFVSWVSQDGQVHDYCHTFVNGMAVAYGIVNPTQGKEILSRVVAKSKSIGFTNWHIGVPGNLIPCRKEDMMLPAIGLDGPPAQSGHVPARSEKLTEEEQRAFGYRYANGTIHPALVWQYLLGLQVAGLEEEADRILNAMIGSAQKGLFQNGIGNAGGGHFSIDGKPMGYEGYLPESYNFLMGAFTRDPAMRARLLGPMAKLKAEK